MPRRTTISPPFRSKFEQRIAKELDAEGVKYTYETYSYEYQEPLRKNRAHCGECGSSQLMRTGWYTPDFFLDNGIIIECKGRFTAADRRKHLAVREAHPKERIVMLFMTDNKIHKNSDTRYSDWCMEHSIEYAIGHPHKEWYLNATKT
jgi:hypothetical protein